MYLTKLALQRQSVTVRNALADCQQMHRNIQQLFMQTRQESATLYRLQSDGIMNYLYLYSKNPPQIEVLPDGYSIVATRDITDWVRGMQTGQFWKFDLQAIPSKKVQQEGKKNSQRRILRTPEERSEWLERKAEQNGFAIEFEEQQPIPVQYGQHSAEMGNELYLDGYRFEGTLRITNAEKFQHALCNGIGAGRAYGFGMLLLRR